jgi:hypothetical protein
VKTQWDTTIDQVIADLESLNHSTEQDFLAVGGKLMEFRSAARQISSEMTALIELISGEHGNETSRALARILEHSKDMDAEAEAVGGSFATIRDLARRIPLAFAELRGRVLSFRTLCTLTRIETFRLGREGSGFEGLADAVTPLSESIHVSGERVLAASSELNQSIQTGLQNGAGLQTRQLSDLRSLIGNVMGSLQSFEERRERAHEASVRQAAQHETVCRAIDGLVQSVQFHDITRQQIEHVIQSLQQLRSECTGDETSGLRQPHARAVLHLQASQLERAEQTFSSSVQRMQRDLEDIAVQVREMAEASGLLMGTAGTEQNSFFHQMESCCSAILAAIVTCNEDSAKLRGMATELAETAGRMQTFVAEIREIEIQIQRISINASIRAAHIGGAGNALNTIADAMHRLVLDSTRNTEEASQVLDSIRNVAHRVSCDSNAASELSPQTRDILDKMRTAVLELHSSSECSYSHANEMAALGSGLGEDIRLVLGAFSAGQLFAKIVTRARAELQRIALDNCPESSGDPGDVSHESLERFASHYTMEAERSVYQSVSGGAGFSQPVSTADSTATLDDDNLGDNVELF